MTEGLVYQNVLTVFCNLSATATSILRHNQIGVDHSTGVHCTLDKDHVLVRIKMFTAAHGEGSPPQ